MLNSVVRLSCSNEVVAQPQYSRRLFVGGEVSGISGEARQTDWFVHGQEILVCPGQPPTELLQARRQGLSTVSLSWS